MGLGFVLVIRLGRVRGPLRLALTRARGSRRQWKGNRHGDSRPRGRAPRAAAGNATVVPITVDTRGATRWVIAVDARCAKRVAFAQGQDAEREDAEAEAGEFNGASLRAGKLNQGERTKRGDGDGDGDGDGESSPSEKKKPTRASPPVGPWRLASNGRAGSGTGTRRYAAFGVGGREARERPEPITVWIETHAVTERGF